LFKAGQYDILFTDFSLPGMNGAELARQLKQIKPDLKIVFASGYGDAIGDRNELDAVIITKPYDLSSLEELLK
jgi:DNA-binding LytR/AlgR family response regulator